MEHLNQESLYSLRLRPNHWHRTLERCGQFVRPGVDSRPVSRVSCRHMVEGEVEFRRVDHATEELNGDWCKPGKLCQCMLELLARALPLLLGRIEWAECDAASGNYAHPGATAQRRVLLRARLHRTLRAYVPPAQVEPPPSDHV